MLVVHCLFVFIDGLLEKLLLVFIDVATLSTLSNSVRLSISVARLSISVAMSYSVPMTVY